MTPQHTGATAGDLAAWGSADYETNQNFALTTDDHLAEAQAQKPAIEARIRQLTNTHQTAA